MTVPQHPSPQHPTPSGQEPADPPDGAGPLLLGDLPAIREAGIRLAAEARREILIFSRDLDPHLYDQQPFLDAVQALALARPQCPVRVLLFEPLAPVVGGHRLIELSRRLSSRIAIRRVAEDLRARTDAFLVSDALGYCLRRLADRHEALVDYRAPGTARRLRADFDQVWEQSDEDSELRRLCL